MTTEYIIRCAISSMVNGKHEAHCYSGENPEKVAKNEADNMVYAPEYAEAGYTQPKRGILFANWNVFPYRLAELLEKLGYATEWSDEWAICDDCARAIRTSPDSHFWKPFYTASDAGYVCHTCEPPAAPGPDGNE